MITVFDYFKKLPIKELIAEYDYSILIYMDIERSSLPELDYKQFEIDFLIKLGKDNLRRFRISNKYFNHCQKIGKKENIDNKKFRLSPHSGLLNTFVLKKLQYLDSTISLKELQNEITNINQEDALDFSNTKGTEKIIYLEKLGILEYLKELEPFKSSTNSLATVISAITGIPKTTAQSYINPIANPTIEQRNNPLNSIKKVEKIEHTLNKIGFKPL